MVISFIVAASENNVIGKDNKLPWCLPTDMRYFKNVTWGMPVIMGRKSFESLGKALKGRTNIVVTRNKEWQAEGTQVVQSIDQAITLATQTDAKEIFIIGGAEIFRSALPSADRIYLTLVHGNFNGYAFFPSMEPEEWKLWSKHEVAAEEKKPKPEAFQVWERKPHPMLPSPKGE